MMSIYVAIFIFSIPIAIFIFFIPILLFLIRRSKPSKRVPPGSLGIPLIGQSLSLLRAMRRNMAEQWLHQRIKKYGPVSKLSLFGEPTVFTSGQSANKLIVTVLPATRRNCHVDHGAGLKSWAIKKRRSSRVKKAQPKWGDWRESNAVRKEDA